MRHVAENYRSWMKGWWPIKCYTPKRFSLWETFIFGLHDRFSGTSLEAKLQLCRKKVYPVAQNDYKNDYEFA